MDSLAVSAPLAARPDPAALAIPREPRSLVDDFVRRPEWLWLTQVVPITTLLVWTGHACAEVHAKMSPTQRAESAALATALIALGAGAGLYAHRLRRSRRLLTLGPCLAVLSVSLIVLGLGLVFTLRVIPDTDLGWIVSRQELQIEVLCLGTPGAFHALLILIARPPARRRGVEFAMLLLAIALGSVLLRELSLKFLPLACALRFSGGAAMVLMLAGALAGGLATTALVTRATLIAYTTIRRMHPLLQRGLMVLVAGVGPLAGLCVNRTIPFPVDLQAPVIYLLALLNGGALLLPVVRSIFWHRVIWLGQCALFPFSAYLFLIFLPWLPASLLAMTVYGEGFLILVPLVLGIVHAYRVADGFREEVRDGPRSPVAAVGLAAMLTLPLLGLGSAWLDRASLEATLASLAPPGQRASISLPGNPSRLADVLRHRQESRRGVFLPYLTPLYNEIVFHGRTLPAATLDRLQAVLVARPPSHGLRDIDHSADKLDDPRDDLIRHQRKLTATHRLSR